jgi:hypothetical protein
MKLTFKEINVYIPAWNGNKKLTESEQIKIHWRYPSAEEVKDIRKPSDPKTVVRKGKIVADEMEMSVKLDDLYAIRTLITNIENLNVLNKDITDGAELLKTPGLNGLVQEISTEIMAEMDKVGANSKNS